MEIYTEKDFLAFPILKENKNQRFVEAQLNQITLKEAVRHKKDSTLALVSEIFIFHFEQVKCLQFSYQKGKVR